MDELSSVLPLDVDQHATASWFTLSAGLDHHGASDDMHSLSASPSLGETYFATDQHVIRATDRNWPGPPPRSPRSRRTT